MRVICDKAIYGTMNAALLSCKKLAKAFREWGLVMNPYDPCVWNNRAEGRQLTVLFHIDDLMMSYVSSKVVSKYIKLLEGEYGTKDPLTVTRGKRHEYLGITIDFGLALGVSFTQYDFIKKIMNELSDDMKGPYRNTPAPSDLFKTDDNDADLCQRMKDEYHKTIAKLLFLGQRLRPDIQLAVGFHCTRVKKPKVNDWKKIKHLIGYVWHTRYLPLIIAIDKNGNAHIYINGAHAMHSGGKGHSGLYVTMGTGAMMNVSKKLGFVTNSSAETEVVSTGE